MNQWIIRLLVGSVVTCLVVTFYQASNLLERHEVQRQFDNSNSNNNGGENHNTASQQQQPSPPVIKLPGPMDSPGGVSSTVGVVRLTNENMFEDTLQSCIPGVDYIDVDEEEDGKTKKTKKKKKKKECGLYVPDNSKERIGILAPPGLISNGIQQLVQEVVSKGKRKKNKTNNNKKKSPTSNDNGSSSDNNSAGEEFQPAKDLMKIIPTTHMAPYGYGKTHGWTRLVRIVPQPLLVGATDALLSVVTAVGTTTNDNQQQHKLGDNNNDNVKMISEDSLTFNDLKASLRQQIRYHCRLNHISAHTALWSVGLEDMATYELDDAEELVDYIQGYFDLEQPDDENENMSDFLQEFDSVPSMEEMYHQGAAFLSVLQTKLVSNAKLQQQQQQQSDSNSMNNGKDSSQQSTVVDILKELDNVLLDEMRISKNLTAWPCESFWSVGEPENRLDISPAIQRIAKQMSPDCTDPLVSCFVKKDKCEHAGDGKCS